MKFLTRVIWAMLVALYGAACATTGDPRAGGLFGWSEERARTRQVTRQRQAAGAEWEVAMERQRQTELAHEAARSASDLGRAHANEARASEALREKEEEMIHKTERLESASISPADASLARSFRRKIATIAAQTNLTARDRFMRLMSVESALDAALR